MSGEPLLIARNVTKSYGSFIALAGVTLTLHRGERRALIGPNGAGKTTFVSVLGGQQSGDPGGEVHFEGRDISRSPPQDIARMGIGRTFQISRTFRKLTVFENMLVAMLPANGAMSLRHRKLAELRDTAIEMLAEIGLSSQAEVVVDTVSLGERKRLEFGMVLAAKPKLLLLDEPTAGMGVAERKELMEMMAHHVQERNITLLFIEHDIDMVFRYADAITVMARGKVLAQGTPGEIAADRAVQDIYLGAGH